MNINSQISEIRTKLESDPRVTQVKDWYQALPSRDQLIVRLVGALLVFALFYLFFIAPLINEHRELINKLERKKDFYQLMADNSAQFSSGTVPAANSSKPLLAVVNQEARRGKVKLTRYEQDGESLRIWMDDAKFEDAILWLERLSRTHAVVVSQINIDRSEKPGYADIRATFTR